MLLEILSELPESAPYSLSLSAGYDSRVLLAGMIKLKRNLVTASMGLPHSTDPRIALKLANTGGCKFSHLETSPEDYLTFSDEIIKVTSGEKVFWHWHTGIYSKKVGFDHNAVHLAGSNGEFVRSYFFDKGIFSLFADFTRLPGWRYWLALKNAVNRRVPNEILQSLSHNTKFRSALNCNLQIAKAYKPNLRFGDGLDFFYASERVRNFIGLGLALYRSSFPTMSPFLDARFIRFGAHLPRRFKLANTLHRLMISQLQPNLLQYPTDDSDIPLGSQPSKLYFLKKSKVTGYSRYKEAQKLPEIMHWAEQGYYEIGGGDNYKDNSLFREKVNQWNHLITIGKTLEFIHKSSIAKSNS